MDNNLWIYIVITLVVIFVGVVLPMIMKKKVIKQLLVDIEQEQFDTFFKRLDSFWARFSIKPYDLEVLRLNGLLAQNNDAQQIYAQFSKIMDKKQKDGQKASVLSRMFYYYLEHADEQNCHKIIKELEELKFDKLALQCNIQYSVLLKKESKYINEVKSQIHAMKESGNTDPYQMGSLEYLVGIQYYYANKKDNARKYLEVALKNLKDTPYEQEIKDILVKLK